MKKRNRLVSLIAVVGCCSVCLWLQQKDEHKASSFISSLRYPTGELAPSATSRMLQSSSNEGKHGCHHNSHDPVARAHERLQQMRKEYMEEIQSMPWQTNDGEQRKDVLPDLAKDWCLPPNNQEYPPLDYYQCRNHDTLARVVLANGSGLGSTIMNLLNAVMWAHSEDYCFYVDEIQTNLKAKDTPTLFINRYFAPIGLDINSKMVNDAHVQNRATGGQTPHIENYWVHRDVEHFSRQPRKHIPSLDMWNMDHWEMKSIMLRRMWRWLPPTRDGACHSLAHHLDFRPDDFLALSIRRGDKKLEVEKNVHGVEVTPMELYIQEAQKAITEEFQGVVPSKVFVATDDCTVLPELRTLRPDWDFVSECTAEQETNHVGYYMRDMAQWSQEDIDEHFRKFFVELVALASAKVFIGVPYTNVTYLAYFMRRRPERPNQSTFRLIKGSFEHIF